MGSVTKSSNYIYEDARAVSNYRDHPEIRSREVHTAPISLSGKERIHRFGFTPTHNDKLRSRELVIPQLDCHSHAHDGERFKRKVGAGRVYGFELLQKQDRVTLLNRRLTRSRVGIKSQERIRHSYDRLTNLRTGMHENRIKNMTSTRKKYGDYMTTDHKSRLRNEFPHVGPQHQTVIKKTPKNMVGHRFSYSVRFDEIGQRKALPKSVSSKDTREFESVFWKPGIDGLINTSVQLKNKSDVVEDTRELNRQRSH